MRERCMLLTGRFLGGMERYAVQEEREERKEGGRKDEKATGRNILDLQHSEAWKPRRRAEKPTDALRNFDEMTRPFKIPKAINSHQNVGPPASARAEEGGRAISEYFFIPPVGAAYLMRVQPSSIALCPPNFKQKLANHRRAPIAKSRRKSKRRDTGTRNVKGEKPVLIEKKKIAIDIYGEKTVHCTADVEGRKYKVRDREKRRTLNVGNPIPTEYSNFGRDSRDK
ncbi:hypothetical protein B0H14DRAFT_3570073 [Mycena olivaceomarginata]|nr:hypothetical protein B0H14DRAFT_3570073 [Mycena olivaceomarginata]